MEEGKTLYEKVLFALYEKALTISSNAYTSTRPTATEQMEDFVVASLPQGILPYSDTHDSAYVQLACYVRDKQGGIENVPKMSALINSARALLPFNDELITCNDAKPLQMASKSDGLGFHSVVIQFRIIIKL